MSFFSDPARTLSLAGAQFTLRDQTPTGLDGASDARDLIVGTSGDDSITGVPFGSLLNGKGSHDTLTGNGGNDIFVLGTASTVYYNDGDGTLTGTSDLAAITDFNAGDRLQLKGAAANDRLSNATLMGVSGSLLYWRFSAGAGTYASRVVAPVLQRCRTHAGAREGHTALLFSDGEELVVQLDGLVSDPARVSALSLAFYRQLVAEAASAPTVPLPPALAPVAALSPGELRERSGWRRLGPRHWRRDLAGAAEAALVAGQEAMGRRQWPEALEQFRQATAADPGDPYALVFLGQALERLQRPALARQAYERAAALDPLCSCPPHPPTDP